MIEINLIPDVKREYLRTRALRNTVISMSILVGVGVVGLAVVLAIVLGGQLVTEALQDRSIKDEGAKLTAIEDLDKTVTIQHQLSVIGEQHASKSINSRLFDVMSAINPPAPNNVTIASLKLNPEEQTITIEGSAANGYTALEVLKKTIGNTYVQVAQEEEDIRLALAQDLTDGDTSFGENAEGRRVLRFSFSFIYPGELFAASDGAVTVVTPQGRVDVTDSKLGVPESLFSERAGDVDGGGSDGE